MARRGGLGIPRSVAIAATLLAAVPLVACGSDEREFGAEEFVREANDRGARLELGAPLSASDPGTELYALSFADGSSAQEEAEGTGGSLRVTDSTEAADAEFARCQRGGLICFSAANVVVSLQEEAEPRTLDGLARAVRAMKSD